MNKILFMLFSILVNYATAQTKAAKLQELADAYAMLNKLNGTIMVTENGTTLLNRGYDFAISETTCQMNRVLYF